MARLIVEGAWVEFSVPRIRHPNRRVSSTGGQIDLDRSVVTALQDITIDLREGDRLGLMGHNGSGKSTMLRLLAGVYSPTRGCVRIAGTISTLFNATPGLNLDGTGRENIVTCGLHLGICRRAIAAKMDEIIDFAELGDYIDLPVRIYSTGMVTRLGFSIATSVEPEILLLDEGLATGDAAFTSKAEKRINELIARTSILVIASHSATLLSNVCNHCLLLEQGRVLADGEPRSLFESYHTSVIERARANDAESLQRAFTITMDLMSRSAPIPANLEEQGLRYALRLKPLDNAMLNRYQALTRDLPQGPAPDMQALLLARRIRQEPHDATAGAELAALVERHALDLHSSIAEVAREALASSKVHRDVAL